MGLMGETLVFVVLMGLMGETLVWQATHLDIILVPAGLIMFGVYHGCLLHRILTRPHTTFIGDNAIHRRAWVEAVMKEGMNHGVLAVQTIRNGIMLCSVVALLVGVRRELSFYGMTGPLTSCIKCMVVLLCLLCYVQCVRYYRRVSFLISTPPAAPEMESGHVEYVSSAFNKGAHCWSVGLRAFYLSLPLFLWNFGPITIYASSCLLLLFLHYLDRPNTNLSTNCPYMQEKDGAKIW